MFSIHDFIMSAIKGMVGRYPDFQVREYSLNWYSKGKLTEEDLSAVEEWLTPVVEETPVEEVHVEETANDEEQDGNEPVEE